MSRSSSSLLLLATLTTGVTLGVALDRGGPFLSAQAGKPAASDPAPPPVGASTSAQGKALSEDALYQQLNRQYEQFQHVNRTFELVSRAVSPAVVHIVAQKTSKADEFTRTRHFEETGSGVIVRGEKGRDLYVLTNHHVIEGARAEKINIFLQDGRAIHPDRFWTDPKADIAVLNLSRTDLPAARLGDSDEVAVGTWVLAMGSPFGLTHSVSQGIISARGRHMEELQDVENQDFLQTDAAINPGNSGGPLINMRGEVIGINNSIASNGGGNEGVGFSIPINLARWIMGQLLSSGRVTRGALGIDLHPEFRPEDARDLGLDRPRGAWISIVHQPSPAASGGMKDNDVVIRFRGVDVLDLNHLINMVSMAPIGQAADVVVWRGGQERSLNVVVGDRDRAIAQVAPAASRGPSRGMLRREDRPGPTSSFVRGLELNTLDESGARRLGMPPTERGALVMRIEPESQLAPFVKPNDVIATVDGRPVRTAEDAVKALNAKSPADRAIPIVVEYDRLVQGAIERRSVRVP
jgi:serine protease Do